MPDDPLVAQTIMVPSQDMARWLKLRLARLTGIAANIRFVLPADWQWEQIRRVYPDLPRQLPGDRGPLFWTFLQVLSEETTLGRFAPLARYVGTGEVSERDTRLAQLARQLAGVFDEYVTYRAGMLQAWEQGRMWHGEGVTGSDGVVESDPATFEGGDAKTQQGTLPQSDAHSDTDSVSGLGSEVESVPAMEERLLADEGWQSELWRLVVAQWREHKESVFQHKASLSLQVVAQPAVGQSGQGALQVFHPGLIPQPVLDMLKWYAGAHACSVYLVDYGATQVVQPEKGAGLKQAGLFDEERQKPAIIDSLGRENARVMACWQGVGRHQVSANADVPATAKGVSQSLLAQVQADVLGSPAAGEVAFDRGQNPSTRESGPERGQSATIPETSPGQAPAPSTRKQIEQMLPVSDGTIHIHSCHSPLREIETLHRFLLSQFETDPQLAPDDVLVVTPDLEAYAPAIDAVFGGSAEAHLPAIPYFMGAGRRPFGRDAIIAFSSLLGLIDSRFEVEKVLDLFMSEPILRGLQVDGAEARELRRWVEDNHVYWGLDGAHRASVGQPAEELQTWQTALRRIWLGQLTGTRGSEEMRGVLLYDRVETRAQKQVWAAFDAFLSELVRLHALSRQPAGVHDWCAHWEQSLELLFDDQSGPWLASLLPRLREEVDNSLLHRQVPFVLFRSAVERMLEDRKASGTLFGRGVVFGPMITARNVPFRIIALVGLNQETFPRADKAPDFDLVRARPEPADRNRKEEDRNLFLASLLSAQKILYMSYVGQDAKDNSTKPPSVVLSEFMGYLARKTGTELHEWIQRQPLTAYSRVCFEDGSGQTDYSQRRLRVAGLLASGQERKGLYLERPHDALQEPVKVPLDELAGFAASPVRAYFRKRFDLVLSRPEEEPDEFGLHALDRYVLFNELFHLRLQGERTPAELAALYERSGQIPAGWRGRMLLQELQVRVNLAVELLQKAGYEPALQSFPVSVRVREQQGPVFCMLEGRLQTHCSNGFVVVNSSKGSGKRLMEHWIKALALFSEDEKAMEYVMLMNVKADKKQEWFRFTRPPDPPGILAGLVRLRDRGMNEPLYAFPQSSYAWQKVMIDEGVGFEQSAAAGDGTASEQSVANGVDRSSEQGMANGEDAAAEQGVATEEVRAKARQAATKTFEGGYKEYAERDDAYFTALLGQDAPFEERFVQGPYHQAVAQMMHYLKQAAPGKQRSTS